MGMVILRQIQYLFIFEKEKTFFVHQYMKGRDKQHQLFQRIKIRSLMAVHIHMTNNRADVDEITPTVTSSMVRTWVIE